MVKNNKGVTLVELIVAVAIMVIVGVAITGFVLMGTRQYRAANEEVNLQYEAQVSVNQIQDLLIDATNGVSYTLNDAMVLQDTEYVPATKESINKKVICAYNCETVSGGGMESAIYTATEIKWDEASKTLVYSKYRYDVRADGTYSRQQIISDTLFAQYVEGFTADLSRIVSDNAVEVSIDYKCGSKRYSTNHTITLRNQVVVNREEEEVFREVSLKLAPAVSKVVVTPSEVYVDAGSRFAGFSAKVIGVNYPIQNVEWSIANTASLDNASKTYIDANTGELTIDSNETCKIIEVVATSLQSKMTAGADMGKYVAGTATVMNKYVYKSGAVTMTEPKATVDMKAVATVSIHGENFEGTEDFTDGIGFNFTDESGHSISDVQYQVKRLSNQEAGTDSGYEVTFTAPIQYKDRTIGIEAEYAGQKSQVQNTVFHKRALKSLVLNVKNESGDWAEYRSGEDRLSKRGENVAFRVKAIYENQEKENGEEEINMDAGSYNWEDIRWSLLSNGLESTDLASRMHNNLTTGGLLQISSSGNDFNAQSEYRFTIMAELEGESASVTVILPKVIMKINQSHESTQNGVGMVVGTPGNKHSAQITFSLEGIVADANLVQLISSPIEGVNTSRAQDENKYTIWASKEATFDLEFGLSGMSDVKAKLHVIAKNSNVLKGNEEMPYYIPPENNDNTFFKGTRYTYYDLYGNKITYTKKGIAMVDKTTYQYVTKDHIWRNRQ